MWRCKACTSVLPTARALLEHGNEIVRDAPMISDVQERWPALFDVTEINAEFKHITTMPLQSRFLSQLDLHSSNLLRVFAKRSGQQGTKLKDLTAMVTENDIDVCRECVIKGLCIHLNEDPDGLVQEYMDMTEANTLHAIERTTVGIYVARETPTSHCSDVGVILEGVVVLEGLDNVALASALLFGLFYVLNMKYPTNLRYTF